MKSPKRIQRGVKCESHKEIIELYKNKVRNPIESTRITHMRKTVHKLFLMTSLILTSTVKHFFKGLF